MRYQVMTVAVVLSCLGAAPLFGADEPNAASVNPDVTKLVERLTTDVDKLALVMPDGIAEEDKGKIAEGFELLKSYAKTTLIPLCTNEVFVREVAKQNARSVSLEDIQEIDRQWTQAEDELPIHTEKMGNACAQEIVRIAKEQPLLGETFVMDNQGANVGQNALTSDYWQGDEAKWKNSYKDGKGGVDMGQREFDKSTSTVDQKVSLPIIDQQGKVIGAVCLGIKIEMLEQAAVASDN